MMKEISTKKGFSLVETLIYIGLLVLIVSVTVYAIFGMVRAQRNMKSSVLIQESATAAFDRLVREIRDADGVDASSTLGTNPGVLKLNTTDSSGNGRTLEFSVSSGQLTLKEDSTVLGPLTVNGVTVTNLVFYHVDTSASDMIRASMTLSAGTSTSLKTETFYTSAILRGSY